MESNDVAKATMNEIWGLLFKAINMAGTAKPIGRTTPNHPIWTPPLPTEPPDPPQLPLPKPLLQCPPLPPPPPGAFSPLLPKGEGRVQKRGDAPLPWG